ncbi:lysophosphatidic acid receptor 6 [Pholidichthys leucotaenia]
MVLNTSITCYNVSSGCINIVNVCIYSCIFIMGLTFNVVALVFFFSQTKSRSHTITYMTNLAIADVLLILTLPMRIYYYLGFPGLPQWLCDGLGLILKANMYGSIFLLTSMCFDRCMAVCFPMSIRIQEARKKARLICLGIWLLTFGASMPIYFSRRDQPDAQCFDNKPISATRLVVVLPTLLVGFGVPLVIMLLCSWGLVHAVKSSTAAQTNLVDSRKIQRMVATSLLVFLLSFLPYHATLLIFSLWKGHIPDALLSVYHYSLMVACLNTVLDPVVYYFTTDTFRRNMDIRKMLPLNSQGSGHREHGQSVYNS